MGRNSRHCKEGGNEAGGGGRLDWTRATQKYEAGRGWIALDLTVTLKYEAGGWIALELTATHKFQTFFVSRIPRKEGS